MKKLLKILGVVFGSPVGLVVIALAAIFIISNGHVDKTYAITP